MKIQFKYLFLLSALLITICSCDKKLKGTVTVSGKVVDAYDGKGIEKIKVAIGRGSRNKGGAHFGESSIDSTNIEGNFNLIKESVDKEILHLVLLYNYQLNYKLSNRYRFSDVSYKFEQDEYYYKNLTKNTTTNIVIELIRVGHLKLNLLKNQTIAVDSIKFGSKLYYIKSDTTLFFITEPNKLNQLECSRLISPAYNLLWKDSIQVGLKGDTISKTIQL